MTQHSRPDRDNNGRRGGTMATTEPPTQPHPALLAERIVIGGMLMSDHGITAATTILSSEDLHQPTNVTVWHAILGQRDEGKPTEPTAVADRLARTGELTKIGGATYLFDLMQGVPTDHNIGYYARIVADYAQGRRVAAQAIRLNMAANTEDPDRRRDIIEGVLVDLAPPPDAPVHLDAEARIEYTRLRARHAAAERFRLDEAARAKATIDDGTRVQHGGSFLLDIPPIPPAVWGQGDNILWARGEALMIAGPQGVGKTTVAGQLLRALLGLEEEVLGFAVEPVNKRVAYLAMDRPEQARRNLGRMFRPEERGYLDEMLRVWCGPLPTDAALDPDCLVRMAEMLEAEVLIIDSLKDAAIGLSKDEVGGGYNRARQQALAAGVQLLELHHNVKTSADGKPNHIKDIYGSTWLTSGVGSIVFLWGEAGDPIVELKHLKQPMNEIGPLKIIHDRTTGLARVFRDDDTDVVALARRMKTTGISAREAAQCLYSKENPPASDVEKARRRLSDLVDQGMLILGESTNVHATGHRWFAAAPSSWTDVDGDQEERYR